MKEQRNAFWTGILISLLITTIVRIGIAAYEDAHALNRENECKLRGYSVWADAGPVEGGLCLGLFDGEWRGEPLEMEGER